jgi:hypothetical protein
MLYPIVATAKNEATAGDCTFGDHRAELAALTLLQTAAAPAQGDQSSAGKEGVCPAYHHSKGSYMSE